MKTFNHPLHAVPVRITNVVKSRDGMSFAFGTTIFGSTVFIPKAMAARILPERGMTVVVDVAVNDKASAGFRAVRVCPDRFFDLSHRRYMRGEHSVAWAKAHNLARIYDGSDRGSFTAVDLYEEIFGRAPVDGNMEDQRDLSEILFWLLGEAYEGRLHETRVVRPGKEGLVDVWFSLNEDDALPMGAFERPGA